MSYIYLYSRCMSISAFAVLISINEQLFSVHPPYLSARQEPPRPFWEGHGEKPGGTWLSPALSLWLSLHGGPEGAIFGQRLEQMPGKGYERDLPKSFGPIRGGNGGGLSRCDELWYLEILAFLAAFFIFVTAFVVDSDPTIGSSLQSQAVCVSHAIAVVSRWNVFTSWSWWMNLKSASLEIARILDPNSMVSSKSQAAWSHLQSVSWIGIKGVDGYLDVFGPPLTGSRW